MKKITIWIIEDSKEEQTSIVDYLRHMLDEEFEMEITCFDSLTDANRAEGTPDFILIDVAAISKDYRGADYVRLLRAFVEKHLSPIYGLYSYVGVGTAAEVAWELHEAMSEVVVTAYDPCDPHQVLTLIRHYAGEGASSCN